MWYDENNDGVFDLDETGIGGVTIDLSGPVTRSTVTAANVSYSFTDLPPGTYTVVENQPGRLAMVWIHWVT
ncbi:MAG: hypothetical protein ACI9NT_002443 [Bacteroidia bacterium]